MSVGWGQDCPENMFWWDCGSMCEPTCSNPEFDPDIICPGVCVEGCFCNSGFIFLYDNYWDQNYNICIPIEDCPEEPSLCDEGYTEIDGECYYQSDLDVVQDFIDSNESLNGYSPITLTSPNNWLNGRLKTFLLYDRGITSIPVSLGNLNGLDMIYFFENEIESVPESIGNLINLTFLDLGRNNISNIPDTIWELVNLTTLNFQENQLTSISDEVCNIYSSLEYEPFLSMNQICPPYPNCLTEENIGYQDTSECETDPQIGDECVTQDGWIGFYDCELCCWDEWIIENWLGDGWCDYLGGCGFEGPLFNCPELGYDCGDCTEDWDGTDPSGLCSDDCLFPGDVNSDSILNILDIVSMITLILDGEYDECGDVNSDGDLNILDVVTFVNIILSIP